jgi:DNA-binding IclR family transcriptional regulator
MPARDGTDVYTRQCTTRRVLTVYQRIKKLRFGMTKIEISQEFELHSRTVSRYVALLIDMSMIEKKGDRYYAT